MVATGSLRPPRARRGPRHLKAEAQPPEVHEVAQSLLRSARGATGPPPKRGEGRPEGVLVAHEQFTGGAPGFGPILLRAQGPLGWRAGLSIAVVGVHGAAKRLREAGRRL
jgi:hypothetical protein